MERRGIRLEWAERAVAAPELRVRDPYDEMLRLSTRSPNLDLSAVQFEPD